MDNSNKSLISKVIEKGVVTPYEAIYLQHLNSQNIKEQISNLEFTDNFYEDARNLDDLLPSFLLKSLLRFKTAQDNQLYDAYQWIGNDLTNLEKGIGEIGYKGLALLNEIRYMRTENSLNAVVSIDLKRPITTDLFNKSSYSYTNQKTMTFADTLSSFGLTLKILIVAIDIILTDNYYLQNMFNPNDLNCIKYLKMWMCLEDKESQLSKDKDDMMSPFLNITSEAIKDVLDLILNDNHPKLVVSMNKHLDDFRQTLPSNFEDNSLNYVKEVIRDILDTGSTKS